MKIISFNYKKPIRKLNFLKPKLQNSEWSKIGSKISGYGPSINTIGEIIGRHGVNDEFFVEIKWNTGYIGNYDIRDIQNKIDSGTMLIM